MLGSCVYRHCASLAVALVVLCLVGMTQPCHGIWLLSRLGPHRVSTGPEVYYLRRTRAGGSHQAGILYGGRVLYERRKPWGLFWAAEGRWAKGRMTGRSRGGAGLKSTLYEAEVEGRFGWTLQRSCGHGPALIPYVGYGYYRGSNKFDKGSPMLTQCRDRVSVGILGAELRWPITDCLTIGLLGSSRTMIEGKEVISGDPMFPDVRLVMENEDHYDAELPIEYHFCYGPCIGDLVFRPFYRYRQFGGRENPFFDFIGTEYRVYGIQLAIAFTF